MLPQPMITVKNPALVRELTQYVGGLFPAQCLGGQPGVLIVKCPKEMILTAKMLRQIKFYLVPLDADGVSTYGLVTAFFDDFDEPLVLRTPLLDDGMGNAILNLLSSPAFDMHFFDEHNRELLGYRVNNRTAQSFASSRNRIHLASSTYIPSRKLDDQMSKRFSTRSSEDDDDALVAELSEELFPSDLVIFDTRPESNSYQGRRHPMFTALERENAGLFSELDIVKFLGRVFHSEQIFLNPLRADNGREFADVVVVTANNLLLIQAKDSPNTEEILRRSIERKMSTVLRHLREATTQLSGSISYVESNDPFVIECGSDSHAIGAGNFDVRSLVLAKELFPTEYESYSRLAFQLFNDTGFPCLIQDYSQFHYLTHHRRDENSFFDTFDEIMAFALHHNEFPRSRFWL